ncbi:ParB/RepB/Spo0J family partition protein [Rathayibacter toxicus]|uniref:Chromosome partitioning protein ParB n=1 Tax=Rathayibacter toxicus TaxID=145458 RepID=A0A0C5BQJ6_9MICO|nr:ParB/RepB/Spo0J family partition protein [Rathayibacter toxicus]AJM76927.1 chromosome partitioning protein ParB [Rathayibacter toxicus]ALS57296.1 chromosome partitioning protein ParB [Rathayibacter toxicus]KKM45734.1 chromosome partitioning protein ParB [Rathayibacter toxicus]PPG24828.1 ParB/RepB/Spo0J family partition protein [Rathayibacter toxicus]PPG48283.1 ParB/RepB/Spo0J family partition protein [Rathayibacter toxicus]
MATKRTGLGRGIGALIPATNDESRSRPVDVFFRDQAESDSATDELLDVPGARLARIPLREIVPNPAQPRSVFDEDDLAELVHSIREFGVLQPIVVRPVVGRKGCQYELVMGERRFRASKLAGFDSIPAVVKDTADENMLRDALIENLHRAELNPLEEASAYQQLLSDFGITQEALASRLGRSRPQISNTLRLLRLPEDVQARVAVGVLSAGHARAILSVDNVELMARLADKIVNEELSVRAAETAALRLKAPRSGKKSGSQEQGTSPDGHLSAVAEHLGDRLNTRVNVTLGARKGQIVIDFATIQDLNRILAEIGEPRDVSFTQ